jgi:hypothetical protein
MVNAMDFSLEEYKALREEILDKMEKCFKILSLGVGGITVILGFVFYKDVNELLFVLPILIFANAYRYKAETVAIENAGVYICKIENSIYRQNSRLSKCNDKVCGNLGWENFLRNEGKINKYKLHRYTADIILGSLYALCVIELWRRNTEPSTNIPISVTISFTILFILIFLYWLHLIFFDLKTKE